MKVHTQVQVSDEKSQHHGRAGVVDKVDTVNGEAVKAYVTLDATTEQSAVTAVFKVSQLRVLIG